MSSTKDDEEYILYGILLHPKCQIILMNCGPHVIPPGPLTGRGRCLDIPTWYNWSTNSKSKGLFWRSHLGMRRFNQSASDTWEGGFHPQINFNYQLCGQGGFRTSQILGTNPTLTQGCKGDCPYQRLAEKILSPRTWRLEDSAQQQSPSHLS